MNRIHLNRTTAYILAGAVCLLAILPFRTLLAEYQSGRVAALLDDPATEGRDVLDVNAETLPAYEQSMQSLRNAIALDSGNASNHKALAELQLKLGTWSEAMEQMGSKSPRSSITDMQQTLAEVQQALVLEPTNPDYHLALGSVYDLMGKDAAMSEKEYEAAVSFYPHNSPLRYAVAMRYLLSNRKAKALAHAQQLAAFDDSYLLSDTIQGALVRERRSNGYLAFLSQSYLYKSYDIVLRTVGSDIRVIEQMTPGTPEAHDTYDLFRENNLTAEEK